MPNAQVIDLPARRPRVPEDEVWQCACGSITFHLHTRGEVQCAECGHYSTEVACWEPNARA